MSFASGFFNSVDHDRLYDATDISRLFDGLIRDGIFASIGDCLIVKPSNGMTVTVGTGRAWFNHTWSYNDALYPVTVPASEILTKRIDAIVLEINSVESVRANSIKLIKGTPAANPSKPSLTNTKEVHQYPLAYITVEKEVTSIRQADIENCVGTNACPFVSGILEVISIDKLIPQWKDTLNRFVETNTTNFNTWMNGEKQNYQAWLTSAKKEITDWKASAKSDYNSWYNGVKNSYNTWYNSVKNSYDQWFATIKAAYNTNWATFQQWEKDSQAQFDTWFDNIKNKLEGDLATKLTQEVDNLGKEKVSLIESEDKILTGTVEAPLLLANATRNLLPYPYATSSGVTTRGVTMVYSKEGTITFSGTVERVNGVPPAFYILTHAELLFEKYNVETIICTETSNLPTSDLHFFFQIVTKSEMKWIANSDTLKRDSYDWTKYSAIASFEYGLATGKDASATVTDVRIVTDKKNVFVPYSGYEIKTCGRNLIPYPYTNSHLDHNGLRFDVVGEGKIKVNGTAANKFINIKIIDGLDNEYLMYLLKRGKDLIINYDSTHNNLKAFIQILKGNTYVANIGKGFILKHDAYDWSTHAAYIIIQDEGQSTYSNDVIIDLIVTVNGESTKFEPFKESSVTITNDTKFPNLDLKTFNGTTNILSLGNITAFHADADNGKYLLEAVKKSSESGGAIVGTSAARDSAKVGDLWLDTTYSRPMLRYWNGSTWDAVDGRVHVGATKQAKPYHGQMSYDPSTKKMYVYVVEGGSWGAPGWYEVGSSDTQGGTYYGASAPSNTKLLWIDTSGVAKYYNGSAWKAIAATWG